METTNKKTVTTVVTIIILLIVAFGVFVFMKGGGAVSTTELSAEQSALLVQNARVSEVGRKLLSLLRPFNTLEIDNAFFKNGQFRSLVDFSVEIPGQTTRESTDNPFAPLPGSKKASTQGSAEGGVSPR